MANKTLEEEILEELESEKQEKNEKKSKKEKKPKAKKDTNVLIKAQMVLLAGIWLGAAIFIAGTEFGIVTQINSNATSNKISTISDSAVTGISHQFTYIQNQLNSIANSEELKKIILNDQPEEKERLASILKNSFDHAESLLIIPWDHTGTVGLKKRNIELRNSIEMSLVTKAGDKKSVAPEAYKHDKTWMFSFVAPIIYEEHVIGSLLLTLNSKFLTDIINTPYFTASSKIAIVNKQQPNKAIISAGTINTNNPGKFDLPFTDGQLVVHTNIAGSADITTPFMIIYATVALGAIFMTVLILLMHRFNVQLIRTDCESITRFAEAKSGIHKTKTPKLGIPELLPIIQAIEALSQHVAKNTVTPHQQSGKMGDNGKTVITPSVQAGPPPELLAKAEVNEDNSFEHPEIFRDYDIRGLAEEQLTPEVVIMIGKAIGSEAVTQGTKNIVVGRDGRLSSERIKKNLIKGLCSTGCNVLDIDLAPSPVLYYATKKLGTEAGIMITGSHNPAEYNGFKIILGGKTLHGVQLKSLLKRIEEYNFNEDRGSFSSQNVMDDYIEEICLDIIIAKPLKVVLDASNGVGGDVATRIFSRLDCEVMPLNCEVDGNFPGHGPDPSSPENLKDLIDNVVNLGADIGIAFDGDADRMVAVTSTGKIVDGDQLLMIFARDIVSRNPAADVVFDIKCSNNISKLITEFGGRPIMCKSGHSHIKSKMQETGALLGGEYTGHFFFKERWNGFDDGIYAALRLVELLTTDEETLDTRISTLPTSISTPEILIPVGSEDEKTKILNGVKQSLAGEPANINTLDGIRIDYDNGWGLIRASNTTKAISARFEAETQEELTRIQGIFKDALIQTKPDLTLPF